jgi:3D (Asp-Asp-Asp) domain-containing protein
MKYNMMRYLITSALLIALSGCATGIRPPAHTREVSRNMEVTGYCKCGKCCGWKYTFYGKPVIKSGPNKGKRKKVGITASGVKSRVGTIAADTSKYPFGTVMYVPGYGYGRVEDRGSAISGQRIDLYFNKHNEALKWGRQTKQVKVWVK